MKMSLATEIASPRSDISMQLVDHIENIRRHKPEITTELFDKTEYVLVLVLNSPSVKVRNGRFENKGE